jgi:MoaA/NifB/PqqE/SkfB family radical SAM enzyme
MRKLATLKRFFDDRALYCQLIVTRRCNLACGYCNEFDKVSQPVDFETLVLRMDHLIDELGVTIMDFLGGEPLLHPRIADLVAHAHERGCWTNIITNGFLLSDGLVHKLNLAGLDSMAVSIDRITPTDFTHKGLVPLRKKLRKLKEHARFKVEVNVVLCEETLDEFEEIVNEIKSFGFPVRCGVRHYEGRMAFSDTLRAKFEWFQQNFRHWRIAPMLDLHRARLAGNATNWKCAGGFKYLYVDEFGTVRACSQVHLAGRQNVLEMKRSDLKANDRHKECEKECGVSCVIQTSLMTQKPIRYALRCAQHVVGARLSRLPDSQPRPLPLLQSPAQPG